MANPRPNEAELDAGVLLGGKYRLEGEIGRGAMGTVWSAKHEGLEQRVAVKIISQEHAGSEELRRRFDTEARAAAKLRSRFVVGVYDNGFTPSGLPYIVMEYLEGECLEDRIARQGCISVAETARIARHVARALSRAHGRGIVHRDLKPANIFITRSEDEEDGDDWTAKVLDFGIAKMDDFGDRSTTKTGTVLGTPLFMSPEQVRGASSVDSRADLYSFGMVVYNMLTGTYAFEGQSFGDLLVSICTDPLPELSRAAPGAPPALGAWFQKTCARDPDDRYQTAEEVIQGLINAIGDTSLHTRMSMVDGNSSSDFRIPLAETYAATSEITQSGSRTVETATVHTVSEPKKRSSFPLVLSLGAAAVAALVALVALSSEDTPATGAKSAASLTGKSAPESPNAISLEEKEAPVLEDKTIIDDATSPDKAPTSADSAEETKDPDEAVAKTEPTKTPATKAAPRPRPATQKTPQSGTKATASTPAPAPAPTGKPAVDLGF